MSHHRLSNEKASALARDFSVTLGMLMPMQAARLYEAGLEFYNDSVGTSPEFYGRIITTRALQDPIDTLAHVRDGAIKVCCGGILGIGERVEDRLLMLVLLANFPKHPEDRGPIRCIPDRGLGACHTRLTASKGGG